MTFSMTLVIMEKSNTDTLAIWARKNLDGIHTAYSEPNPKKVTEFVYQINPMNLHISDFSPQCSIT